MRRKRRNKFSLKASEGGVLEDIDKINLREARKIWELGKHLGLIAEDEDGVVEALADIGVSKRGCLKRYRRKKNERQFKMNTEESE